MHGAGSLQSLLIYFFRLGASGFGGPLVLVGHMYSDLVAEKKWISEGEYKDGIAFAQLSPGPLAAQLAMYLGWIRFGWVGATLSGIFFVLPSFLIVLGFATLYVKYGNIERMQSVFSMVGAAVIGIVAKSAIHLSKNAFKKDALLWVLFLVSLGFTVVAGSKLLWVFLASGLICLLIEAPPNWKNFRGLYFPAFLLSDFNGPGGLKSLAQLGLYFSKMGALVFGSGLAIVPILHNGVVDQFHWLTERQFLDSVAIGMITPGPILITSGFIGYLVAGIVGALVASISIFLPSYLIVIIFAPIYQRFKANIQVKAFVSGVVAAAIGGVAGSAITLGRHGITDILSAIIAAATFVLLISTKKVPEPLIIFVAAVVGVFLR